MKFVFDPNQVQETAALINSRVKNRERYPEGVVTPVENDAAALAQANPAQHIYPAIVLGPSRSSEGVRVYYLVKWL